MTINVIGAVLTRYRQERHYQKRNVQVQRHARVKVKVGLLGAAMDKVGRVVAKVPLLY